MVKIMSRRVQPDGQNGKVSDKCQNPYKGRKTESNVNNIEFPKYAIKFSESTNVKIYILERVTRNIRCRQNNICTKVFIRKQTVEMQKSNVDNWGSLKNRRHPFEAPCWTRTKPESRKQIILNRVTIGQETD